MDNAIFGLFDLYMDIQQEKVAMTPRQKGQKLKQQQRGGNPPRSVNEKRRSQAKYVKVRRL